jgi:hypothetical protein
MLLRALLCFARSSLRQVPHLYAVFLLDLAPVLPHIEVRCGVAQPADAMTNIPTVSISSVQQRLQAGWGFVQCSVGNSRKQSAQPAAAPTNLLLPRYRATVLYC